MPWIIATLRGQRVYARVTEQGQFVSESGRVEIRYKPKDGRMYRAAERNLSVADPTLLPDDTCADASEVQRNKDDEAKKKSAGKKKGPKRAPMTEPSSPEQYVVYTDGACSSNPGPAGSGVVWLGPDGRHEASEFLGEGTNNIAELTAILRALEGMPLEAPAVIHTDSRYSIGVLQDGWKAKANRQLITTIRARLEQHTNVELVYVKGHAGIELNERADELARLAVETRKNMST